jgi:hypothetical protein
MFVLLQAGYCTFLTHVDGAIANLAPFCIGVTSFRRYTSLVW